MDAFGSYRSLNVTDDVLLAGLAMLQELIQLSSSYDGATVALKQLRTDASLPGGKTDYTPLLKHTKELLGENRIIVQADLETSRQLLSQVRILVFIARLPGDLASSL